MEENSTPKLPVFIDGGKWNTGHVQGITVDSARKYIYYSFTTVLVKTDLEGNLIGYVGGLVGHLGCIDFCDEDGRVYGSLEYKHDSIGAGISKRLGYTLADEDAFYVAIFNVDKITRPGMDAEKDGIVTAVYLGEVVDDYSFVDGSGRKHRYSCSGIDGTAIGPVFGEPADSPHMLMVAYGIYGDVNRDDNDYQIIMQFDYRKFGSYEKPLTQGAPHHSGIHSDKRYFLYTGNTTWGVQNLEYDAFTGDWLVAVYKGQKPSFPNFPMFVIDGSAAPFRGTLPDGKEALMLTLKKEGIFDEASGIYGNEFNRGTTGMYSFGDGNYYFSHEGRTPAPEKLNTCHVHLYNRTDDPRIPFALVK